MAKASKAFVCQACGAVTSRWSGKCAACGEWNSIIEEAVAPSGPPALVAIRGGKGRAATFEGLQTETRDAPRLPTGIAEFDRVLGGGLVPGSAVLVGGDPGIGKSTLLLQAAAALARLALIDLFRRGEVSSGYAAQVLGMSREGFLDLLARHGVPAVDLSEEELRQDLEVARWHWSVDDARL